MVDDHVVVFGPVAHLVRRPGHAAGNLGGAVLGTGLQPPLELAGRRRQDEDPHQILRHRLVELLGALPVRSEEHTSELQSLMRISYAVFCLKKKNSTSITIDVYTNIVTT